MYKVQFLVLTLFLITIATASSSFLNKAEVLNQKDQIRPNQILYLIQIGKISNAIQLYRQYVKQIGQHDFEILQHIGLGLLDYGYHSKDPEIQLMTLFGAGTSNNEKALYILLEGVNSSHPILQLIALNFLARYQNDSADEAINRAMTSNYLLIRLEAAYHLAKKKASKAIPQLEALMYKVDSEYLELFPELFLTTGNAQAIKIVQRLLNHQDLNVRLNAIHSLAHHQRDDVLPQIRALAKHHDRAQQEACAYALGVMKDGASLNQLFLLSQSGTHSLRLAALQSLYRLGRKEVRSEIESMARKEDLFAIHVLAEVEESRELLYELSKSSHIQTRINAALALLEHQDSRCLPSLIEILVKDDKDLGFVKIHSVGQALTAWKVVPSSTQNFQNTPIAFELSLNLREEILNKALDLDENCFLKLAHLIFDKKQNDLIPVLVELLQNLQSPPAIELLKKYQQMAGAPLIRNYCNLALYCLKEEGPYLENLHQWVSKRQDQDLIQFRSLVPWKLRESSSSYQLTPEETSALLIRAFEAFLRTQDEKGIDILLDCIEKGKTHNKYALAGLLIRAAE